MELIHAVSGSASVVRAISPGWIDILHHVLGFTAVWVAGMMVLPTARFLGFSAAYQRLKSGGTPEAELVAIHPRLLRAVLYQAWMRCLLFTAIAYAALGYYHRPLGTAEVCGIFAFLFLTVFSRAWRTTQPAPVRLPDVGVSGPQTPPSH